MLLPVLLAASGVAVPNMTHLGVVTSYASCIAREVGDAPAQAYQRKAKLDGAVQSCRARIEKDYAEGRFTMNGAPFPKSWWQEARKLFDKVDGDAGTAILETPVANAAAERFKVVWQLNGGKIVPVGNLDKVGTVRVRIVAAG